MADNRKLRTGKAMLYVRLDQVGDETYGLLRDTCLLKASVKYRRVRDIYADFLRVFGGKDISDLDRVDAVNGCAGKVDLIDSSDRKSVV